MSNRFANKAKAKEESKPAKTEKKGGMTITLFDIRRLETSNGTRHKVQFAKDVTVQYKGEDVDLGEYNSLFVKNREEVEESLSYLVDKEIISEETADKEVDFIDEKGVLFQCKHKLS